MAPYSLQPQEFLQLQETVKDKSAFLLSLQKELKKVIIGQTDLLEKLVIGLISQGHILLEGAPGLAKTLAIKTLAAATQASFSRIQFTPDLLPADLTGSPIYNPIKGEFSIRKGPIFANLVLADEINRAPAKVQSALLQAMQERQVTIGDTTFNLPSPFLVLATQNPLEQEGTYPLAEAQQDRFMFKLLVNYPSREEELLIIRQNMQDSQPATAPVFEITALNEVYRWVKAVYIDEKIEQYILSIVEASRRPEKYGLQKLQPLISHGVSPRGSIFLTLAAKARAFLAGRAYTLPEDVRILVHDVFRHRLGLTYEAEAESLTADNIIAEILQTIEVP
jgi:MoxR-like ATPase